MIATLAKRFDLPEHVIEVTLIAEGMRHERTAATLRNGLANVLAMARETGATIEEDLSEVA